MLGNYIFKKKIYNFIFFCIIYKKNRFTTSSNFILIKKNKIKNIKYNLRYIYKKMQKK